MLGSPIAHPFHSLHEFQRISNPISVQRLFSIYEAKSIWGARAILLVPPAVWIPCASNLWATLLQGSLSHRQRWPLYLCSLFCGQLLITTCWLPELQGPLRALKPRVD